MKAVDFAIVFVLGLSIGAVGGGAFVHHRQMGKRPAGVEPAPVSSASPATPAPAAPPPIAKRSVEPLLPDMPISNEVNHAVVEFDPEQARITESWSPVVVKIGGRRMDGFIKLEGGSRPSQYNHPHGEIFLAPTRDTDKLDVLAFEAWAHDGVTYRQSFFPIEICGPDNRVHSGYLRTDSDETPVPTKKK